MTGIGSNFVSIAKRHRNDEEEFDVEVSILNKNLELSDFFSDVDISDLTPKSGFQYFYPLMKELFRIAGRSATGADAIIDDLLSNLEGPPTGAA